MSLTMYQSRSDMCIHRCHCRGGGSKSIFRLMGKWISDSYCHDWEDMGKRAARTCAGGNVLLERGQVVSADKYKALKEKVLKYEF